MRSKTMTRKMWLMGLIVVLFCFSCGTISWAAIPQHMIRCQGCHTNHDGGHPLLSQYQGPQGCVNCHSSDTSSTTYDLDLGGGMGQTVTVPVVVYTGTTAPTNYLSGGNFFWVQTEDSKGHNIFDTNPEDVLTSGAPGIKHGVGCAWSEQWNLFLPSAGRIICCNKKMSADALTE